MTGRSMEFGIRITADGKVAVTELGKTDSAIGNVGNTAKDTSTKVDGVTNSVRNVGAAAPAVKPAQEQIDKVGISAKQTAAALRGVPAQFTDIFTSVAAGQNPMQVFLQQGGQLKDMFGGAGPAARALGGYVLGLINPFTVAAAAAGGLAYAYAEGNKEASGYTRAIIMSGNAAGVTTGQLSEMATRIAESGSATRGAAAEAVAALTSTGAISGDNLQKFAAIAVESSRVLGLEVGDMVKDFEALGQAPVQASLKLNESMRYLTAATYAHIKAAQDLGETERAASIAQNAYAQALKQRAIETEQTLGTVERAWNSVKEAAKGYWDIVKQSGREETNQEAVTRLQRADAAGGLNKAGKERLAYYEQLVKGEQMLAQATADRISKDAASIRLNQATDQFLDKQTKQRREIAKIEAEFAASNKSSADVEARRIALAGIAEKYADKKVAKAKEAVDYEARAYEKASAALEDQIAKERDHIDNLGLTRVEQERLDAVQIDATAGVYDLAAANALMMSTMGGPMHDTFVQQAADLQKLADRTRELAGLKRESANKNDALDASKKAEADAKRAADASAREWQHGWEETDRVARDVFTSWADGGGKAAERIGRTLKSALLSAIYEATVKKLVFQVYASVVGGSGGGASSALSSVAGAGGSGGFSLNGLSSLSNLFSGGIPSLGGALGNVGSAYTAFSNMMSGGASFFDSASTAISGVTSGTFAALSPYVGSVVQLAQGNYAGAALSAGGALLGNILLPGIGGVIGGMAGSLLGSMFGGGGEDPHNNAQVSGFQFGINKSGVYGTAGGNDGVWGPASLTAGPTSGNGWWGDSSDLSSAQVSAISQAAMAMFAQAGGIASILGVNASVLDSAGTNSGRDGTYNPHLGRYYASVDDAFTALGDDLARKLVPQIDSYRIANKSLWESLTTSVAAVASLRAQFDAFKDQLGLSDFSDLDPLSKYRMAKDLYNEALAGNDAAAVTQTGQQFLAASRAAFASSEAYSKDYQSVLDSVTAFSNTTVRLPWDTGIWGTPTPHVNGADLTATDNAAAAVAVSQDGFTQTIAKLQQLIELQQRQLSAYQLAATNPNLAAA